MAEKMQLIIDDERLMQALIQAPDKLEKELNKAIDRSLREMARDARGEAPKAFSQLVNSINVVRPGPLEGTVGPSVDYGQAVEEGTGVFGPEGVYSGEFPPVENILDWIGVVGLTPNDPNYDQEDLAWAIATEIALTGTQAQPYLAPAFEKNIDRANRRFNEAIERSLQ